MQRLGCFADKGSNRALSKKAPTCSNGENAMTPDVRILSQTGFDDSCFAMLATGSQKRQFAECYHYSIYFAMVTDTHAVKTW